MKAMTFVEFEKLAAKRFEEHELIEAGRMRVGQVYFNTLYEVRPDVASKLRASSENPFYKELVSQTARYFVLETWYE